MNLTIDIGNSSVKMVVFDHFDIIHQIKYKNLTISKLEDLYGRFDIQRSIVSSVRNTDIEIIRFLKSKGTFVELTAETPLPIRNRYETPQTLGKDRIAAVVGGFHLYPNTAILVIDAGTCITYDLMTAEGEYLGGNIAPGLQMRFKAMHHFTAKLPLIQKQRLEKDYGYNTETAIRTGGQMGFLFEIEGFIQHYEQKFGHITTIITGGDANFFVTQTKREIFAQPNLVPIGLNKILLYGESII